MDSLIAILCAVDDLCKEFVPLWQRQMLNAGEIHRQRKRSLTISEIMTILIHFHQSHYRNFKAYYNEYVLERLRNEFPGMVSYNRFVEFIRLVLVPLCVHLRRRCFGVCTGISFIDSTLLKLCHKRRIQSHKVFAGLAEHGKSFTDWFYGFKKKLPLGLSTLHVLVAYPDLTLRFCFCLCASHEKIRR